LVSRFAEGNLIQRMSRTSEKYSILKLGTKFSIYLKLNTYYEYMPTTIKISHLVLPVVSAELPSSIIETRQKPTLGKLSLIGSYLFNLPNSGSKYL
jgi:hypothetical protein